MQFCWYFSLHESKPVKITSHLIAIEGLASSYSPDLSILSKGQAAFLLLLLLQVWASPAFDKRMKVSRNGFLREHHPPPRQRKKASTSALAEQEGSCNPSLPGPPARSQPVSTPVLHRVRSSAPAGRQHRGRTYRTKKGTARQASSHPTVFLLLPSFPMFFVLL